MNKRYIKIIFTSIILLTFMFIASDVWSQCPMCRMSAESNLAHGGTEGKGLNRGILYMFAMPYLLVASLGYLWWKNSKKVKE